MHFIHCFSLGFYGITILVVRYYGSYRYLFYLGIVIHNGFSSSLQWPVLSPPSTSLTDMYVIVGLQTLLTVQIAFEGSESMK